VTSDPIGLRGKLLILLLAFGGIPLVTTITVGYLVSRSAISRQATSALEVLTSAQSIHLATELDRERLLLQTIAGQLPGASRLQQAAPGTVALLLTQSLPEGGVFDGLRVVTTGGGVLASVALRNTAPHWPDDVPAADWRERHVVVHRQGEGVLAYLVSVPVGDTDSRSWLEGHVRAEDFTRVFSIPEHLMNGAESGVVDREGRPVLAASAQGLGEVLRAAPPSWFARPTPGSGITAGALLATYPVAGTDWRLVSALPLDVALAPLARLRDAALAGSVILVVLIVLTGAVAARTVTTPLRELADAAVRFGRDRRYVPVPVRAGDEVGVVVESFNTMAAGLVRSREELEAFHARDLERAQQLATVGELASGVAHEIRNPLTGIRGALELTLRSLPPEAASRPLLEEAQHQLKRIEATTTQLLRYARPPEPREIVTDANLLVDRAVTIVAPQAASAGVVVQVEATSVPLPVRVDPELLVQVLVNLLLNAIETMAAGGAVAVWLAQHAPEAWIGVRDTGSGVSDTVKADIFRPFFTTKHQGTGLGLPISRQIVTRHGGTLRVEDTPGGGATFVVTLPLAKS